MVAAAPFLPVSATCDLLLSGGFLSPDEVTFAVLLRGHGAADPPAWQQMDAVLNKMQGGHGITPSAGEAGGGEGVSQAQGCAQGLVKAHARGGHGITPSAGEAGSWGRGVSP
jgi:hypothetical protein